MNRIEILLEKIQSFSDVPGYNNSALLVFIHLWYIVFWRNIWKNCPYSSVTLHKYTNTGVEDQNG